jgi:energy-coupling factor transporter transmembrane protein EcfT
MFKGYPQPWRTWLLILSALIIAVIIVQLATSTGWVLVVVLAALVAVQFGLARYARRQP